MIGKHGEIMNLSNKLLTFVTLGEGSILYAPQAICHA